MTEAIKHWMNEEMKKEKVNNPRNQLYFSAGLTKGIEIAEGFPDWANQRYTWVSANWWDGDDDETFTTSQLLEKYLKTLEP